MVVVSLLEVSSVHISTRFFLFAAVLLSWLKALLHFLACLNVLVQRLEVSLILGAQCNIFHRKQCALHVYVSVGLAPATVYYYGIPAWVLVSRARSSGLPRLPVKCEVQRLKGTACWMMASQCQRTLYSLQIPT